MRGALAGLPVSGEKGGQSRLPKLFLPLAGMVNFVCHHVSARTGTKALHTSKSCSGVMIRHGLTS